MAGSSEQRHAQQEAALLSLLERIGDLEKALRFEVSQREHMEQIIVGLAMRSDRFERFIKAARRAPRSGGDE